jgi:hypothetical protein
MFQAIIQFNGICIIGGVRLELDWLSKSEIYECRKAQFLQREPVFDSIDWDSCEAIQLVDTVTGFSPKEHTEVRACWSHEYLYIRFICEDPHIVSNYKYKDDPLYEQDVVEVFIDEEGLGLRYLELEVSPNNIVFDARIENNGVSTITKLEKSWSFTKLKTSVHAIKENQLCYFICIPAINFTHLLQEGVRWRVNFYRIDEAVDGTREYQAWRPTGAVNYHIPSTFGTLVLI